MDLGDGDDSGGPETRPIHGDGESAPFRRQMARLGDAYSTNQISSSTPSSWANRCATRWLTTSREAARKSVRESVGCDGLWKMNRITRTRSSTGPAGER